MYAEVKYVIHKHDAKKAGEHFDLRIEIPYGPNKGKLASFAIPKAKFPDDNEKLLAIRTPDHSRSWLTINGTFVIDPGEYGEGVITVFQKGKMNLDGFSDKYITFTIEHGEHINGRFSLIKFRGNKANDKQNLWILMRVKQKDK